MRRKTLLKDGRQTAFVLLCDGQFYEAYPLRVSAEIAAAGFRKQPSSKRGQWKVVRASLVFAAARYRRDQAERRYAHDR